MKSIQLIIKKDLRDTGFGFLALHQAKKRNITGFLKYGSDGFPYFELEGKPDDLDGFIKWCRVNNARSEIETRDCLPSNHKDFLLMTT